MRDHQYDVKGEDHLRYMHYTARDPEENKLLGQLYAPGHTDLGSITLLFRQPVCGLQILNSEGQWKWVVSDIPSQYSDGIFKLTLIVFVLRNLKMAPLPSTPATL